MSVVVVDQAREEIRELREAAETLLQRLEIQFVVLEPFAGLSYILQGELRTCSVFQSLVTMTQRQYGIVHLITAVGGPISGLGHARIKGVVTIVGEQRLPTAIQITLVEVVCLGPLCLANKERASVEEVGAILMQQSGVLLSELKRHPTLRIGTHIEGVECLGYRKQTFHQREECQRVLLLLEIQPFVGLVVLTAHGFEPHLIDAFVILIHCIFEKRSHQFLRLGKLAALD